MKTIIETSKAWNVSDNIGISNGAALISGDGGQTFKIFGFPKNSEMKQAKMDINKMICSEFYRENETLKLQKNEYKIFLFDLIKKCLLTFLNVFNIKKNEKISYIKIDF